MAVIAFPNLSPQGPNARMQWELRSITARHFSPLNGVATTLERPGAHWAASLPYANLETSAKRARLQNFAASCRGHAQRFYMPVLGWTRRGSFSAPELLTNNTFASGTTGWSTASTYDLSASDGLMRSTRNSGNGTSLPLFPNATASVLSQQLAAYCGRFLYHQGRGAYATGFRLDWGSTAGGNEYGNGTLTTSYGMLTETIVPWTTALAPRLSDLNASGLIAGDYLTISYASLARCALVDNGPNVLLRSDEIDNATWIKARSSITANASTAPDGAVTGDRLVEDGTASNTHYTDQTFAVPAAAADFSFSVALKAGTRTWASISMFELTGVTELSIFVNLSTGAIGAGGTTGANWANKRSFVAALGNGWYQVTIVGRKTNAATSMLARVWLATADGTISYNGDGTSYIDLWRGTVAQSSVPSRLRQTTTAATTGTLQTGSALYLKGLPASTNGLLLQGDPVEIVTNTSTQLVRARSALNSDAAGLGYFEFEAPIRISPLDNAAVIINNPLCRMMLDDNTVRWSEHDGTFTDLEFTAVEDTYP